MKNEVNRAFMAKKTFQKLAFVLCTISLCTLIGCQNQNPPVNPDDPKNVAIRGNVAKPAWEAPADSVYDMTSSMTAVIKADLSILYAAQLDTAKYELTDDDLIAAFAGDKCLGVIAPKEGLFYLFICSPATYGGGQMGNEFTLRYYSASLKNIFASTETYTYVNDGNMGGLTPLTPTFKVVK